APEPTVRVQRTKSSLGQAAIRGPLLVGMIALAVALGAAVYIFRGWGDLLNSGQIDAPSPPVVTTQPGSPPTDADQKAVFVRFVLRGKRTLFVDGHEVGTWDAPLTLSLPPGRHSIDVKGPAGHSQRDVLLIPGTEP